ncbi:MAG: hypothetical protein COU29_00905 [Candidatus Magasanikbacteria bacterium CG10_big_fil_rev_8_21_14_0_10_36_32]|uniref:Uncharacterized protein n=1 Tax=Candidatus Magasanikbacteria bacterium CG10_big_fil_rev_8_21_14_0_10_36_32 TaxID=1974646 RepID=A0A2M6W6C7_9BACT|nr:MAG: hypothetical protein COU29_00905 [Candidatus Magasanikbacteria bacterium CG10_big_fil_rev_8_21_14_0_10_36_32]
MSAFKNILKMADEQFIHGQIMSQLNLDFLSEKERIELLDRMNDVINQRVLLRIFEQIGNRKQDVFTEVLEKGSDDELNIFIQNNAPNFLDILQEEIMAVKKDLIAQVSRSK